MMEWTTEAPKEDGFYWWRRSEYMQPEIVQVWRGQEWWRDGPRPINRGQAQWWGPIPLPPENPKVKEGV